MMFPHGRVTALALAGALLAMLAGSVANAQERQWTAAQVDSIEAVRARAAALNTARAQAKELFSQRKYREAAQAYKQAIALDSTDAPTYFNLGLSYESLDSSNRAVDALRRAIALDPKFGPARLEVAKILLVQNMLGEAEREYVEIRTVLADSMQYAAAAEQGLLNVATEYTNEAVRNIRDRNHDAAEQAVTRAMQLSPQTSRPFYIAGFLQERKEEYTEAAEHYQQALANAEDATKKVDPLNGLARVKIAQARAAQRANSGSSAQSLRTEAVELLRQAVAIDSTNSTAMVNLGNTLYDLDQFAPARDVLVKAERLDRRDDKIPFKLAETYMKLDQCAEAEQAAGRAIAIRTTNASAHNVRGEALRCLGRKQDALREFEMASRDPRWRQHALYQIKQLREELGLPVQQ